ncbi:hypothetical protein [Psychromonas aquimarina]|uniref:hypothetical protein n=1 Tax=Psychromonas aquimarina TaxID=444919 RepID=UPI000426C2EF|nr:hypothetical protein [Psychromonas aquimarina]
MTEYLILFAIIAVIYFVLIRNRPARKTDWESLPLLNEYEQQEKSHNEEGQLCCCYCGATEMVERLLKSEKENPDNTKYYHACTQCKVILWRAEQAAENRQAKD